LVGNRLLKNASTKQQQQQQQNDVDLSQRKLNLSAKFGFS
jgi:hypothetical protein